MRITPALVQTEFIGLKAKVVKSSDPGYAGIGGEVVNETRNTLVIRHKGEDKTVVKNISVFHFTMPDGTVVEVDGNIIAGRPEDRVKKLLKRRW